MAVFQSSEELYGVMGPFLDGMLADPDLRGKFVKAKTSFRVQYTDPDTLFLMDCTVDPPVVYTADDAAAREAEVGLVMTADDGHRFWLGKLNIPVALAKKKVSISGPLTKLMGLLPALAPAFGKYKIFLKEHGREDLL